MACYTTDVAKSKDNKSADGAEIVEVVHPGGDNVDQEFLDQQNAALIHYKLTGVNDQGYIDTTRDQEPDIAPEFGVSPHPELANPAPPRESFSGRALDPKAVPMVKDAESKEEDAKEATERFNEQMQAREELFQATKDTAVVGPLQRVVIVDEPEASDVKDVPPVADESVKSSEGDASAQLSNASDGYVSEEQKAAAANPKSDKS